MANELVFSQRQSRPNIKEALKSGPRNAKGDPQFTSLEQLSQAFNEEDLLFLVNKALYQLDYQSSFHKKRNEEFRLLRQAAKAQQIQSVPTGTAAQETETVTVPPAAKKGLATRNSLSEALAKLRRETDTDLGPSGTFDSLESVPPQDSLSEEDEQRLDSAFARPVKTETED